MSDLYLINLLSQNYASAHLVAVPLTIPYLPPGHAICAHTVSVQYSSLDSLNNSTDQILTCIPLQPYPGGRVQEEFLEPSLACAPGNAVAAANKSAHLGGIIVEAAHWTVGVR